MRPDRDKWTRALPATAAMEQGRVLLPRTAPWLRDFEAELLAFPQGYADQTDCLSYAVEVLNTGHFGLSLLRGAKTGERRRREQTDRERLDDIFRSISPNDPGPIRGGPGHSRHQGRPRHFG